MANNKKQVNEELGSYVQETPQLEPERITKLPEQTDFYKVPRRFGSIPVDELPLGCDKKEQYYKIYPRISLPFQKVESISFGHPELPPNRLFFGDNLHVMRMLPSESIDLIYLDPPFFSGRNYNVIFGDANEVRSFTDIWEDGMPGYLMWLNARLLEMKRLLKQTGSIYVHLDWHASHYVKVEMDKIFGFENFRNSIQWKRQPPRGAKATSGQFSRNSDTILFYSKTDNMIWNNAYKTYDENFIKSKFRKNSNGRLFRDCDLGDYSEESIKRFEAEGRIYITKNKKKRLIRYLDEEKGEAIGDIWNDIAEVNSMAKERIGYPTQKPEALLERILKASSDENNIVADFFCGGGTTLAAAQRLGRHWIGCDTSRIAVAITADRITNIAKLSNEMQAVQQTIVPISDISIEYWGIYEIPSLTKLNDNEFRSFVVSAYNGRPASDEDEVHGYKEGIPLYVGSSSQDIPITKEQVMGFAKTVRTKKGKNRGIMLAWAFAPSAQTAASRLEDEKKVSVEFVKLTLIPIESEEFRKHITTKHKEYSDLLVFILPPEVRVKYKRTAALTYEIDISESTSINIGGKIINVQWDFDYDGKFVSTQGYSFIREKNLPKLSVAYTFPTAGVKKIACKVQDDKGGERTEIIELEVK